MSINDLPEDVVKHEIMSYLKPVYKVWEVTYLQITTKVAEAEDSELDTTHIHRTGMFRLLTEKETARPVEEGYRVDDDGWRKGNEDFNPYNGRMSQETLDRMDEIQKNGEINVFHKSNLWGGQNHFCCVYISHRLVCS